MLLVTITNIDGSYYGYFDTDDRMQAANLALAALIESHHFFPDNFVAPIPDTFEMVLDNVVGMVALEGEDPLELVDQEDTYFVQVRPLVVGEMYVG
jgi:hypothetical protein